MKWCSTTPCLGEGHRKFDAWQMLPMLIHALETCCMHVVVPVRDLFKVFNATTMQDGFADVVGVPSAYLIPQSKSLSVSTKNTSLKICLCYNGPPCD